MKSDPPGGKWAMGADHAIWGNRHQDPEFFWRPDNWPLNSEQ